MKAKLNPKVVAMMAACALIASVGNARAQGMPQDTQQLVQTMRPMDISRNAAEPDATASAQGGEARAYGGVKAGASASASGHTADACSGLPRCDVFFGH
jgi:poly(3-hydroxybutyrate) depolymerase